MELPLSNHAVKAVIMNERGEVLFLQRNAKGRADGKSNWDLPGGLVENDENDEVALAREIDEELHAKSRIGRELGRWTFFRAFDAETVHVTNYDVFIDEADDDAPFQLSNEHVAMKWVPKNDLIKLEVKDQSIFSALGFEI